MHWSFLSLQINCKKSFTSDKYVLSARLDEEEIANISIDFPKLKGDPYLDKMIFFNNFLGRV